jgi:hypothetical protein
VEQLLTYGITEHVEASLALTGLSAPRSGELSLGAGFKRVAPRFETSAHAWEQRLTLGASALVSLDDPPSAGGATRTGASASRARTRASRRA